MLTCQSLRCGMDRGWLLLSLLLQQWTWKEFLPKWIIYLFNILVMLESLFCMLFKITSHLVVNLCLHDWNAVVVESCCKQAWKFSLLVAVAPHFHFLALSLGIVGIIKNHYYSHPPLKNESFRIQMYIIAGWRRCFNIITATRVQWLIMVSW